MAFIDKDKKLVIVYLSKLGCIDYVKVMARGFKGLDPLLVISPCNRGTFEAYKTKTFKTYDSKIQLLLHTLTVQTKVNKLLNNLKAKYGDLQVYIPAFHPWNIHFIKWVKEDKASGSVVTIHDYLTHLGESSTLIEKLQKSCIKHADKVICLTNYVRQQIVTDIGYASKCSVEPLPLLDTTALNELKHSAKPKLLFLGRGVKYKGLDNLLAAVEDLNIEKLTIAGQLNMNLGNLSDKVHVIDDYIPESLLAALLEEHHILVLPYIEASQSGILSLGINAKMVMVVSAVGGLPEQLNKEAAIWVEPNTTALKKGIQSIISNKQLYSSIKTAVTKEKAAYQQNLT